MNENNTLSDQLLLSEEYQNIIFEEGIALQVRHTEHWCVSLSIYIYIDTHTLNFILFYFVFFFFFINVYTLS